MNLPFILTWKTTSLVKNVYLNRTIHIALAGDNTQVIRAQSSQSKKIIFLRGQICFWLHQKDIWVQYYLWLPSVLSM